MGSWRPLATAGSRLAILLIAATLLAGSAAVATEGESVAPALSAPPAARRVEAPLPLPIPAPVLDPSTGMRDPPIPIPLELRLPTLARFATMLGVGLLANDAMDAPMGKADNPDWQQAFWYRGSAIPGALSTAVVAGHISDPLGRPGVFGYLNLLIPGDPVIVHDTRTGLDVTFSVTDTMSYPIEQTTDPGVLTQIYGAGPVAGTWPQPSPDGLARLTLVTCDGTFRNGTHDHRLVVHAIRVA
jgi:Sortase domain